VTPVGTNPRRREVRSMGKKDKDKKDGKKDKGKGK
jgi:hypothetical protein